MMSFDKIATIVPKGTINLIRDIYAVVGYEELNRAYEEGVNADIRGFQLWNKNLVYRLIQKNRKAVKIILEPICDYFYDSDFVKMIADTDEFIMESEIEDLKSFSEKTVLHTGHASYLIGIAVLEAVIRIAHKGGAKKTIFKKLRYVPTGEQEREL